MTHNSLNKITTVRVDIFVYNVKNLSLTHALDVASIR